MKKEWQVPKLDVLEVSFTMGGPGNAIPDSFCTNNEGENHDGMSNNSCKVAS